MSRLSMVVLLAVASLLVDNNEAVRVRSGAVRLGSNPGVVVRLSRKVLDKAFAGATKLAGDHVKKIPLPDISATISGVELQVKELGISDFDEPKLNYQLHAPNRIIGSLEAPKFGVEGPYNATRSTLIKTQYDSGIFSFIAHNIKVKFDAVIGECETGTPNIESFDCTAEMGQANMNVKNAKEKFAIEVFTLGAKAIRPIVTTQVCATAKRIILDEINRYLAKVPNVISLHPNFAVKYQVKPQVSTDYVQLALFAKVLTQHVNPVLPTAFVECPAQDPHVSVFLSDVIFNELAFHAHANNKLGYTVRSKDLSVHPLVSALFSLKCDCNKEACLGCVLPHLADKYGAEADIEFTLKADKPPTVAFVNNKATFTASIHGDLSITPARPNATTHHETGSFEVTGSLQPKVHQKRLYAKAAVESVKINIDNQQNKQYEQQVHDYFKKVVEEIINDFLFRGIPLDLPFGFGLNEPQVCLRTGTLQLNTGFEYQPNARR